MILCDPQVKSPHHSACIGHVVLEEKVHWALVSLVNCFANSVSMSMFTRVAVIRCVALDKEIGRHDNVYKFISSVSVKVHATSVFSALLETVTVQTQRHAALWQDAALWDQLEGKWVPKGRDSTRHHLLEIFSMAQQFCVSGVRCPAAEPSIYSSTQAFALTHNIN